MLVLAAWDGGRAQDVATATVRWQAPSTGSPAVQYLVRIQDLDGPFAHTYQVDAQPGPQQSFSFDLVQDAHRYQGRVAGVDAAGRQGDWSPWSAVYNGEMPDPQP